MKKITNSARGVAIASAIAVAISASATFTQAQSYDLSGGHVAIYNLVGQVNVQPARGSAVTVDVNFGGPDGNELRVETGGIGDAETLRVIYPDDQITYSEWGRRSRTELRVRSDGTFSDSDWRGRSRGDEITISGRGGGLEAHADLTIAVPAGQRVSVYLAVGEAIVENVNGDIRIDTHSAPVFASGTSGTLTVDVGSGQVEVRGAEGDVELDTGSGSIDVSDVSGGSLLIDTGSGSVTAVGVAVDELNIDTGSGRITAEGVSARDIMLDTGSGSVELEVTENADNIEIDTGSGGVRVTVPDSFGASVDIDTGSGGIELDMPITMRRWQRDHVQGTIGDGGGRLLIDTGSGSVRILSGR
jgi:lia operon protein LiaG